MKGLIAVTFVLPCSQNKLILERGKIVLFRKYIFSCEIENDYFEYLGRDEKIGVRTTF